MNKMKDDDEWRCMALAGGYIELLRSPARNDP